MKNKKEMSGGTKDTQGRPWAGLNLKLRKITRKISSYKPMHIAIICITLLTIVCSSAVMLVVEATEAEQMLTPQSIVLQPTTIVSENDSDSDGYRDSIDACPKVAPTNDDGTGCEAIIDSDKDGYLDTEDACPDEAPTEDDGSGCQVPEPVGPAVDYSRNLIHEKNTDMSYMHVYLSANADYYSNGYYCGSNKVAYEEGTDAILVAMGSQYDYGQYYEVEISNYGTVIVKKVEEKGHTQNNEGYIGTNGDSVELMVCDGFDPQGHGKSSNLGMYVEAIYEASY